MEGLHSIPNTPRRSIRNTSVMTKYAIWTSIILTSIYRHVDVTRNVMSSIRHSNVTGNSTSVAENTEGFTLVPPYSQDVFQTERFTLVPSYSQDVFQSGRFAYSHLESQSPDHNSNNSENHIHANVAFPWVVEHFVTNVPATKRVSNGTVTSAGTVYIDLQDCIKSGKRQVTGSEGTISLSYAPVVDIPDVSVGYSCAVDLIVPQGMVAYIKVARFSKSCLGIDLVLLDDSNNFLFKGCPVELPSPFVTYSNMVTLQVKLQGLSSDFRLSLNFLSASEASRPQLSVNLTSPTTGYLQTPVWEQSAVHPPFTNSRVHLMSPDDHVIVISFHIIETFGTCWISQRFPDHVTFRVNNTATVYRICDLGPQEHTKFSFYPGNTYVEYRTYNQANNKHFRILFSYHHISALPVALPDGRWNCSTVYWPDMQQHFPCNFQSQCVGGEDEAACWQNNDKCSPGLLQTDGRCFSLVRAEPEERISWYGASFWCQQRGGRLASLSTSTSWDSVKDLLNSLGEAPSIIIGAKSAPSTMNPMYRTSWLWSDGTVAHFLKLSWFVISQKTTEACASTSLLFTDSLFGELNLSKMRCEESILISHHLCEVSGLSEPYLDVGLPQIHAVPVVSLLSQSAYIRCPRHHFTHVFLAFDEISDCWGHADGDTATCSPPLTSLPSPFKCSGVEQSVPYTLVCDHRADCKDGSDEEFCHFPACEFDSPFRCSGKRCVAARERCNGQVDCDDGADEARCSSEWTFIHDNTYPQIFVIINLNSKGNFEHLEYTNSSTVFCPETHFVCVSLQKVCIPVFLRCNGINDCPGHEDEAACDSYSCPGFYRCRGSQVCVHESHVCDGIYQCPQRDDEILCNKTCPSNCVCHGWAFICFQALRAKDFDNTRYLDASGTLMTLADLHSNTFLVHLILQRCNLTSLHEAVLPNLRILDLSNNELTHINNSHFSRLKNLVLLKVGNNPLIVLSLQNLPQTSSLKILDISGVKLTDIEFEVFDFFTNLTNLNLSGTSVTRIKGHGFRPMKNLRVLDLHECPITEFPPGIFKSLTRLETVYADNYKLCCPATLPSGFNVVNCHAPSDEVSSCDDLLRSNLYRVGLAIITSLALLGNLGAIIFRFIFHKTGGNVGYNVFVTNLCVADFLMSVYLLIIGAVDQRYRGVYLWEDVGWRRSVLCKLTGFTCLLSSEVSVVIIFFITLDRFLVLHFPFSQLHFGKCSAQLACAVSWLSGIVLAFVPLLPMTSYWEFYGQTSICIPLPTSRANSSGRTFSFFVFIVLNFIFFLLIFIGQIFIYYSIRCNSISAANTSKAIKDSKIARRLIRVVMSDFLCWFPVGLTGILTSCDIPVSSEVNVGIAIFVLPFNAALNPYLYTLGIYRERRRCKREEKRQKRIIAECKFKEMYKATENTKLSIKNMDVHHLIQTLLKVKVLSQEDLQNIIRDNKD